MRKNRIRPNYLAAKVCQDKLLSLIEVEKLHCFCVIPGQVRVSRERKKLRCCLALTDTVATD
jgi:hypothetical protein